MNTPFRSQYEAYFAKWLQIQNLWGFYEPLIFDNNYIPDFLIGIPDKNKAVFVEVKGTWEAKAYPKVRRFSIFLKEYNIPIFVITTHLINLIKKEIGGIEWLPNQMSNYCII
ncbi:MAG: hypothetical protein ACUVUQ_07525 [Thermodesulfovibrionales bacterium]